MSSEEAEDYNLYKFQAPPVDNRHPEDNETSAIIGAVAACVIISAVLLFLWKMLQRKQQEMHQFKAGAEVTSTSVKGSLNEIITKSDGNDVSICKATFGENHNWQEINIPHSTLNVDDDFVVTSTIDINHIPEPELILPPLSPVQSSSWSQKEDMASADTGYNSGFCRKDSVLKRRIKGCSEELYMEHPRDILKSLKKDREEIRNERMKRKQAIASAIETLQECKSFLTSAQQKAGRFCSKNVDAKKLLKQSREKRKRSEWKRKHSFKLNLRRQNVYDKREAFVSMQDWFDGLHLHTSVYLIAEDVFLLRSEHRSDLERSEHEKAILKESICCLRECSEDITRVKEEVRRMQNQASRCIKKVEGSQIQKQSEESQAEIHHTQLADSQVGYSTKQAMFPKTKKSQDFEVSESSKTVNCQPSIEMKNQQHEKHSNGIKILNGQETQQTSTPYPYNLLDKQISEINPKNNHTKTNPLSPLINRLKRNSNTVQSSNGLTSRTTESELLTLTLCTLSPDDSTDEANSFDDRGLSEREVYKALKRVPNITATKSLTRESNNNWTILVSSPVNRISNVRFNCRGKTYILGMKVKTN